MDVKLGSPPFYLQEQPPLSVEQAQAVSAALEQLHQASQAMGVQGIHGMGMQLPPGHTQHEQAMQLPLQHQVGSGGIRACLWRAAGVWDVEF